MKRRHLIAAGTAAFAPLAWAQSGAPAWPARPITLLLPVPPGGLIDTLGRSIADELSRRLGQPVVVDNRAGAGGIVATQAVARAPADGYTILLTGSSPIVNLPLMQEKMPYEVRRDLAFVNKPFGGQLLAMVNASDVPATTMQEFVDWAARNKGKVSYGSYGPGTAAHLIGSALSQSRKLDMVHVPYRGEAQMVQELVAGQTSMAVTSIGTSLPHLQSGRLRVLAVLGDRRIKDLPQVPTMAEAGFPEPEYATMVWAGIFTAAGVPPAVLERLDNEIRAVIQTPAIKTKLQFFGMQPIGTPGPEFRREYEPTLALYERLLRTAGTKAE